MGSYYNRQLTSEFWTCFLCTDQSNHSHMKITPPTHKAADHINQASNFEVWPYTVDTGCPVSDLSEAHYHDFYVVHFVTEGHGTQIIDFESYSIEPGNLYFISPRQLHMWKVEDELKGFIMAFTEDFLVSTSFPSDSILELDFFHSVKHSPVLKISESQTAGIANQMHTMQEEFTNQNDGYLSVLRASFHIFIVKLQRIFATELSKNQEMKEHRLVRKFKQVVSEKYEKQLSMQEYSELLNISVSQLNSVIKDSTGLTPSQIVRNEQVLAAKRLLAHSTMNVAEICFKLNFEDPSYFGRFFKRETGYSPLAFRGTMREKYHQLAP